MSNILAQVDSFSTRLKQERRRLKRSQTDFAALGGVQTQAQLHYEKGSRRPNSDYLIAIAAAGVDVQYLITGEPAQLVTLALSVDEQRLVAKFRDLKARERRGVLALVDAIVTPPRRAAKDEEQ
jgi:transcriptional regulator with XRE-family HTH domain